jgi:hypothetical protein
MFEILVIGGVVWLFDYIKKRDFSKKEEKKEKINMSKNVIIEVLKNKIVENINNGLYMKSLRPLKNASFSVASNGQGLQVEQLDGFILEWEHFEKIVKKANTLGGKMYRGDELPQVSGFTLGEEISHDCMEGFIASELLFMEDGASVTRRSTYYSGILAWADIVTLHKSQGKGSYITVNVQYRNI